MGRPLASPSGVDTSPWLGVCQGLPDGKHAYRGRCTRRPASAVHCADESRGGGVTGELTTGASVAGALLIAVVLSGLHLAAPRIRRLPGVPEAATGSFAG